MIEKIRGLAGSVTPTGWILGGAVLLAIGGLAVAITSANDILDDTRETAAAAAGAAEVVNSQNTTLQQIGDANAAGNEVRNGSGSAAYDQCLRDVEPGFEHGCEPYRADEPVPGRSQDPGPSGPGRR